MVLLREAERLCDAFTERDIPFVVLKGAHLAEDIYDHFACRPMADIDILVRGEHIGLCNEILVATGYHRLPDERRGRAIHDNYLGVRQQEQISIELHRRLTNAIYGARFDTHFPRQGVYLPPEYNLVYLSWHAVRHSFFKLIWLCDCAGIIKKYGDALRWDDIVRTYTLSRARRQVHLCLHLIGKVLTPGSSPPIPLTLRESLAARIGERILFRVHATLAARRDPNVFTKLLTLHTMERRTLVTFALSFVKD